MHNLRPFIAAFGYTFPYLSWLYLAFIVATYVPAPGFLSDIHWQQLVWLTSPILSWLIIAILDKTEVFEYDKKGGRLNWVIAWVLFAYCMIAPEGQLGHIPSSSPAWIPALVLNVLATLYVVASMFSTPGSFRRSLDRELNLFFHGTTWKPARVKDHGSATLGDVKLAAKYYTDGEIIFGTAKEELPEAESLLGYIIRSLLHGFRALKMMVTAVFVDFFVEKKDLIKSLKIAFKSTTNDSSKTPLLKGSFNGHMLVVSGSGGGKTASFVLPNTLNYQAGSMLVIDPKSEIYAVSHRSREERGHTAYILKPGFADTDSFNCIGWVDPDSSGFTKDCMTVSSWIFPEDSEGGSDGGSYYQETAKRLFAFTLAYTLASWKKDRDEGNVRPFPTLVDVYNFLFQSAADVQKAIVEIDTALKALSETSVQFGTATSQLKTWASSFVGGDMEKTWPNTVSSVQKQFWWIGDKSAASIISGNAIGKGRNFSAQEICNGKTSIYVCIPLSVLESTPGLARLVIGAFLNSIFQAEGKSKGTTLFMIDEMQILGNFPILHQTALNQGRGYGITLAGIIQAPSALEKQAGKGVYDAWVDNTMLQMYFAIGGEETAEKISKQIGDTTVEENSYSGGTQKQRGSFLGADNSGGLNISTSKHARRLRTAAEIMNLDRTYAVVFRRVGVSDKRVGKLPMIVGTSYYKDRPELMVFADDNPYERKSLDESDSQAFLNQNATDVILQDFNNRKSKKTENDKKRAEENHKIRDDWDEANTAQNIASMALANAAKEEKEAVQNAIDKALLTGNYKDCIAFINTRNLSEEAESQIVSAFNENMNEDINFETIEALTDQLETDYEAIKEDDVKSENTITLDAMARDMEDDIETLKQRYQALNLVDAYKDNEEIQEMINKISNIKKDDSE